MKIKSVKPVGTANTLDLEVNHPLHQFYCNGILTSNSHSVSYTLTSIREYWLKKYYDPEFNVSLLNNSDKGSKKDGENIIARYLTEIKRKGYDIIAPSVNYSVRDFSLKSDTEIVWGFGSIKNLPDVSIDVIVEEREIKKFESIDDFYTRCNKKKGVGKRALDALVWSGSLDEFMGGELDSRSKIHEYIFTILRKDKKYETIKDDEETIIEKEIEYCNFSLSEASYFVALRENVSSQLGVETNALYEADDVGTYYVVGKIEGVENKKTRNKNAPYKRISLRDETKMLKHVYAWPWKCRDTDNLKKDMIVAAKLEHDDSGFINLKHFDNIA